jgi:hypothetical protein
MGLGPFAQVSLAEARAARDKARAKVRDGIDPIEARQTIIISKPAPMTFDQAAAHYIRAHADAWRNVKHRRQWATTLASYVSPVFGALPVDAIDTGLVMRVLDPLWKTRPETASPWPDRKRLGMSHCARIPLRRQSGPMAEPP